MNKKQSLSKGQAKKALSPTEHIESQRDSDSDVSPHVDLSEGRGELRGMGLFGRGGLQLVLLQLIYEKPRHGYELIKAIEARLGGRYSPSPGVVYPRLTMLEEAGYINTESPDAGGRKQHAITALGEAFLQEHREQVDALMARMAGGVDGVGLRGGRPAPVTRAIENLKLAIRLRLAGTPLTEEQTHAFAAILDQAAIQLERLK